MPWSSKAKQKRAVRGCFFAAGKDPEKKAKCKRMARRDVHGNLKPAKKAARK